MTKIRYKTKQFNCKYCGIIAYKYNYSTQEYCSKKCYYQSLRDLRPKVICSVCGKQIQRTLYRANRNGENYCNRFCYETRRSENRKKNKRQTSYMQEFVKQGCVDCKEKRYYLLQVHHIDGNPENNIDTNLEVLCANCHIKRHLGNKNGKLVYGPKYYLTDRKLLNTL